MYYFLAILPVLLVLISLIVYIISYYNDIYNFMPKGAECFSRFKGSPISSIHFKKYENYPKNIDRIIIHLIVQ